MYREYGTPFCCIDGVLSHGWAARDRFQPIANRNAIGTSGNIPQGMLGEPCDPYHTVPVRSLVNTAGPLYAFRLSVDLWPEVRIVGSGTP